MQGKPAVVGKMNLAGLSDDPETESRARNNVAGNGLYSRERVAKPSSDRIKVRSEELVLPTYLPSVPDKNPMFLEKRVYQGSSGKVYPLPFTDRIADKPVERAWRTICIENRYLRVVILPELGGRIHSIRDKTNGYDLIYNQQVIKPALVGLAGPWVSGGIEFNWPQHHRPATFLPVDYEVEEHPDGSRTVWCGDHDPMARMKGMHGVCLHPDTACLELKVRAYNRTPFVQTFLWWANVATRVHEHYQSFFPPDVFYVADHARRSTSEYPLARGIYYGVNYGERARSGIPDSETPRQFVPPHCRHDATPGGSSTTTPDYAPNDLSFYANIPTPCSYMCMGSKEDFFGGYDYAAQAGIVHIANHHISPGKKQWTWGNHEFGYAWDRNLTDRDPQGEFRPYIEIMAGVYTDNQPDFSFLQPGETKSWSQYWYPIRRIGPPQHANVNAAVSLALGRKRFRIGLCVTRDLGRGVLRLERSDGSGAAEWDVDLVPGKPFIIDSPQARKAWKNGKTVLRVLDGQSHELIVYSAQPRARGEALSPATEPPPPEQVATTDELFITGLHLEQYRHATRCPTLYWREALRRDSEDSRCNNALGIWHLRRGEFGAAEVHFRKAIGRLTQRNSNPYDGEAYYHLGLCLRYLGRDQEAYPAFYKATWNQAWAAAGFHALAEIDCTLRNWAGALEHLDRSLRFNADNLRARNLKALVLRELGQDAAAGSLLRETRGLDRLDWWARHLDGEQPECDLQTVLDIAHDYVRAGFYAEAIGLLKGAKSEQTDLPDQSWGAQPIIAYTLGWLEQRRGNQKLALKCFKQASGLRPDYCFPARLEEIAVLEAAIRANPGDARAPYLLGNLFYDRRRHEEAIRLWERSTKRDRRFSITWRNLGIAYWNIRRKPALARRAYDRAFRANPADARLAYERDQLWKRLGETPANRLRELEKHPALVRQRDDLNVELCALYNQAGRHEEALAILQRRNFQPWEGGEGGALGQWVRSNMGLGAAALRLGDAAKARLCFEASLAAPQNLGEAKHLLANQSDIHFWLGCTLTVQGEHAEARKHWRTAADFKGDFQEMRVRPMSEMTYYSARAWECLGHKARAAKLLTDLLAYGRQLQNAPAKIDYFATSLPAMLLFEDDIDFRQHTTGMFLQAQARLGLGQRARALSLLRTVLRRDPNHALAADLLKEAGRGGHAFQFAPAGRRK